MHDIQNLRYVFVCGSAEAASVENLASCLGKLVTAKVKEALAHEPG